MEVGEGWRDELDGGRLAQISNRVCSVPVTNSRHLHSKSEARLNLRDHTANSNIIRPPSPPNDNLLNAHLWRIGLFICPLWKDPVLSSRTLFYEQSVLCDVHSRTSWAGRGLIWRRRGPGLFLSWVFLVKV